MEHPEMKRRREPRAHKLSRKKRVLLFLLPVVLLALAFVLLLPVIERLFPSGALPEIKADLPYRTLDTGSAETLSEIRVTHLSGESYTLLYRDQKLYLKGENGENTLINESYIDAIVESATAISVEDTVTEDADEVAENLVDMGLEPPQITIDVSYADGRQVRIELGALVPETTYHYYRWSGDRGIYMCDAGVYETFEYTAHMLLAVDQPRFTAALIDRMTLQLGETGELRMSFVSDGVNGAKGTLLAPFAYPMDASAANALLTAAVNFRLGAKQGPVTAANRAEYGFDAPTAVLEIHQQAGLYTQIDSSGVLQTYSGEASSARLTFGRIDDDYFYYCEYAGECYLVSRFLVTTFLAATPDKLATRAPADMGEEELSAITVQAGGGVMDLRVTRTERVLENNQLATDEAGNVLYDVAVTVNGEPVSTEAYDALVARLKQMTVSAVADTAPAGTPSWQMTLTTATGTSRVLSGYALDAFTDLLTVDGVARHTLNNEALRIALGELWPGGGDAS